MKPVQPMSDSYITGSGLLVGGRFGRLSRLGGEGLIFANLKFVDDPADVGVGFAQFDQIIGDSFQHREPRSRSRHLALSLLDPFGDDLALLT